MPRLRDVSHGMYGAWRLARLDPAAMAWFDRSHDGVWRSFWAAAIAYPGVVLLVMLRLDAAQWSAVEALRILVVESIGYVASWAGFLLVILPFCRWLERDEQSLDFVVAYNWSQVLQTALSIAALLAFKALPEPLAGLLALVIILAQLGYEWFIARTALEAGGVAATVVVLIDLVLSQAVSQVAQSLY